MAVMAVHKFQALNIGCFILLLILTLSYSLSLLPLLLAITIMLLNIYNTIRAYPAPISPTKLLPGECGGSLGQFQTRVRQAYDQSMSRQAQKCKADDYYWSKNHLRQSPAIEQLRKHSLANEYKTRRDSNSHRDEGSSAKKVRAFFQEKEERLDQRFKERLEETIAGMLTPKRGKDEMRGKIGICLKIMNEYINNKLEGEIDTISEDFEAVSRFLSRCFSLSLTLHHPASSQTITHPQLNELVRIIDQRQIVPPRFPTNLSFNQVSAQLNAVRDRVARLPNFALGGGVLRMILALKHIKKEFPEEVIILADFFKQERNKHSEPHIIRLQDNDRFFYNRHPEIKSRQAEVILLLLIVQLMQTYYRTNVLARNIHSQIQSKY